MRIGYSNLMFSLLTSLYLQKSKIDLLIPTDDVLAKEFSDLMTKS